MDSSSSSQWPYPDPRQQRPRPTYSQPPTWQQAQNLSPIGTQRDHRTYQATVEDAMEDSGMYHGSSSSSMLQAQLDMNDPYAWARTRLPAPTIPLASSTRATLSMATRRSHASFSPPSLVSDSSTLSSASSNFSPATPTFGQQPRRRSSQQAFPDQIDRDALARANKRMASEWLNLSESPFQTEKFDPFAPLPPRAPLMAGSGLYAELREDIPMSDAWSDHGSSTQVPLRRMSQPQPQKSPSAAEDASAFKSYLNSELNRRKVADKSVSSIRSEKARAVAQAKENARRTDWAKNVLLKFPIQCALAESLRPEDMMAVIARSGVYELASSIT